jgi:serine/threonine protein kinase, bacterial
VITLTLLGAASEHQQWQFELCAGVRVGRALDNDVVLANEQVSRYHLELSPKACGSGGWQLQGLGTNGTLLNGKFVTHGDVFHGDRIQLGLSGPILKFELRSQASLPTEEKGDFRPLAAGKKKQSAVICAHEHNEPGNRFCIHCGEPL